jgi:hypothetical protein
MRLSSVGDVVKLLGTTINECRKGLIDVKIVNATAYAASVLLRALTDGDLERRLTELERQLAARLEGRRAS